MLLLNIMCFFNKFSFIPMINVILITKSMPLPHVVPSSYKRRYLYIKSESQMYVQLNQFCVIRFNFLIIKLKD